MTDFSASPDLQDPTTHAGFVAIVGKPNVGKSTLLNAFLGTKVAPTSPRPQTTRRGVRGIYTLDNRQLIFVDTPGLHKPKDALGKYMNSEVHSALSDVDAVVWVVDLRHPPTDEDRLVANSVRDLPKPLFLVGNKTDAAKYPEEAMKLYGALLEGRGSDLPVSETMLSAQNSVNAVATLREQLLEVLPENPFFFPQGAASDQSREMWAAEIIREEAMKKLRDELPYAVATRVNRWTEREDGLQRIEGEIIVEKNAHKGMVIGAGGKQLREIGQAARKQLEVFLNHKVYLGLEVIVIPGWREDEEALRELGYE
ncbi:GTPase Era [Deinococcus radiodurans]|jgi:GTP-binding protein Era|uniref:GTPase Era n=1 Tax=Deinococcus radiodurans (strain ATCC 13939 / DSM 20539 / JCM 16871 / CCUG 27074 / LMG 4051 / NBRC 15346 / NCIMB 9279 / VKM B-1422 / R1) TaxID=243230 RepID=ERA_DEIRA|nr:GTPase Era [Deinococcus radiodurans]Q9RWM0.1 RecName: Full=GTPase Era [Deinococcus radiodurans R1 = ATCC 13939 = DSM 20539]AAF10224.1 GTP-binding protein Era [Deinococcus radiodurans R1 = ATCC 13939 = DSM 20539]ANC72120.1 GTPase Era [Deinococcus radiodurans R1 = ATCC 13939 = DSM 20539]QEM72590.1 GTPase Era [Deinococcus radiodurans]QIP28808.1 GTPase Era [Deinococcus radiodurans]QIP32488.1 GTPase Era [Deinococcus radiodurans]